MVATEQERDGQNAEQELKLWEVAFSQPDGGVIGDDELTWRSSTILVAGTSQDDAREEARKELQNVGTHRVESSCSITTVRHGGRTYRITLEPVE